MNEEKSMAKQMNVNMQLLDLEMRVLARRIRTGMPEAHWGTGGQTFLKGTFGRGIQKNLGVAYYKRNAI